MFLKGYLEGSFLSDHNELVERQWLWFYPQYQSGNASTNLHASGKIGAVSQEIGSKLPPTVQIVVKFRLLIALNPNTKQDNASTNHQRLTCTWQVKKLEASFLQLYSETETVGSQKVRDRHITSICIADTDGKVQSSVFMQVHNSSVI